MIDQEQWKKAVESVKTGGREKTATGYKLQMRVSLDGIISRLNMLKRKPEEIKIYGPILGEFVKHFDLAKQAFIEGDMETVGRFFTLYIGEKE